MEKDPLQEPIDRDYIARLKGLLIILVIIGHFIDPMANAFNGFMGSFYRAVRLEIYSFHMMLFSFVSGFLSKSTEKRRASAFQELFLVYIIGQLVFGVLYFFIYGDAQWLFDNLFLPGYGLWYLLALFIWRMLLPDLLRFRKLLIVSVLLTLGIGALDVGDFLAMRRTLSFFVFFLLGYCAEPRHINAARKIPKVISGGCFIVEFIFLLLLMQRNRNAFYALFDAFTFACRGGDYDIITTFMLHFIAIVAAVVNSTLFFSFADRKDPFMEHVGRDTMPAYLSHVYFAAILNSQIIAMTRTQMQLVALVCTIGSILIFSLDGYRKKFHRILKGIIRCFYREAN